MLDHPTDLPVIDRYVTPEMEELWSYRSKYNTWLDVEFAFISARACVGRFGREDSINIRNEAKFTVAEITQRDAVLNHDMIAFIETVQASLETAGYGHLKGEFHKGLSSYNVEDPAEVLRLRGALELIIFELKALYQTLCRRAEEHRYSYLIAETHGQWAKPSTFGHLLKVCAGTINRCIKRHERDLDYELMEANISGAVGNFIGIDPRIAKKAAEILGLKLTPAETQILQRDRHAAVLAHLAITARVIENISETLWLMARSIEGTIAEPFSAKQKGSSAMPHKKNPITIERMKGLARLVSADALVGFEDIVTRGWRTIEQSSAERHIIPRATTLVHYMARKMTWIITEMTVDTVAMKQILDNSNGVWASQDVSEALVAAGVDPEVAYRYTQRLGQMTAEKYQLNFRALLAEHTLNDNDQRTAVEILSHDMCDSFFDLKQVVNPGIDYIFADHQE